MSLICCQPGTEKVLFMAVSRFYGRDRKRYEEISTKLNVTRERVRQLGDKALKQLAKSNNIKLFRD